MVRSIQAWPKSNDRAGPQSRNPRRRRRRKNACTHTRDPGRGEELMASAWIMKRTTKDGNPRYRVLYRIGGRESAAKYAGTFKRKNEAQARRNWVISELAALRVPDLSSLAEPEPVPKFADMAK